MGQIDQGKWDAVFGDIPESYSFFRALENSQLPGFKFYYLVAEADSQIALIAPLFTADFNLDIAVDGWPAKIIQSLRKVFPRFLVMKTLFCGSPFGESGILGIRQEFKNHPEITSRLLEGIQDCRIKAGAALVVFKDFQKQDTLFLDTLLGKNYAKIESFPTVAQELRHPSFKEYLQSLDKDDSKYLNRKLKQAYGRGKIEVEVVQDASHLIDQVVSLYENTYQNGGTKFEHLTEKFFLQVARDLSPHTHFFLYYVDGRLAAFNLCFIYKNLFIDKFIGFDYEISRKFNLYFVSQAYNINWCLEHSLCYYYSGQTNYATKLRLGGKLIPLYAYIKHRNSLINAVLGWLAPLFKPDNFDEALRQ